MVQRKAAFAVVGVAFPARCAHPCVLVDELAPALEAFSMKSALGAIPLLSRSQSTISISAYLGEQPPGACLARCCPRGEIRRILARKSPCLAPSHTRNGPSEPGILSRPTPSSALIRGSRQWILRRRRLDFLSFTPLLTTNRRTRTTANRNATRGIVQLARGLLPGVWG
jgi:hypothetical protein